MERGTWNPNGHADGDGPSASADTDVPASAAYAHADSHTTSPHSDAYPDLDAATADGYLYGYADSCHGHANGDAYLANSHRCGYAHPPYVHTDDCANHTSRHSNPYPTSHLTTQWLVCRGHTSGQPGFRGLGDIGSLFASARKSCPAATLAPVLRYS